MMYHTCTNICHFRVCSENCWSARGIPISHLGVARATASTAMPRAARLQNCPQLLRRPDVSTARESNWWTMVAQGWVHPTGWVIGHQGSNPTCTNHGGSYDYRNPTPGMMKTGPGFLVKDCDQWAVAIPESYCTKWWINSRNLAG